MSVASTDDAEASVSVTVDPEMLGVPVKDRSVSDAPSGVFLPVNWLRAGDVVFRSSLNSSFIVVAFTVANESVGSVAFTLWSVSGPSAGWSRLASTRASTSALVNLMEPPLRSSELLSQEMPSWVVGVRCRHGVGEDQHLGVGAAGVVGVAGVAADVEGEAGHAVRLVHGDVAVECDLDGDGVVGVVVVAVQSASR